MWRSDIGTGLLYTRRRRHTDHHPLQSTPPARDSQLHSPCGLGTSCSERPTPPRTPNSHSQFQQSSTPLAPYSESPRHACPSTPQSQLSSPLSPPTNTDTPANSEQSSPSRSCHHNMDNHNHSSASLEATSLQNRNHSHESSTASDNLAIAPACHPTHPGTPDASVPSPSCTPYNHSLQVRSPSTHSTLPPPPY